MALQTIANVGIAVGPPLAYADQYISILRKQDASGFSTDICGVLLVANVTRCFYWLGARFEIALLAQSLLMIVAQFALLFVCLKYSPARRRRQLLDSQGAPNDDSHAEESVSKRPWNLWQWDSFGMYVEAIAVWAAVLAASFLVLHSFNWYINTLGVLALGIEATLPVPQLIVNFRRSSTAGFRYSVLASWFFGDAFKTIYYLLTPNNTWVFKACGTFQFSVDCLLALQTWAYRHQTREDEQAQTDLREHAGVAGPESLGRTRIDLSTHELA